MALLLRTVRETRWIKGKTDPLLAIGDVPIPPLVDLASPAGDDRISVWVLEPDQSNLERVVRAVAVGRNSISDAGYVIFDEALLEVAGIGIESVPGKTQDIGANAWHRDLVRLTGKKLVALTRAILENGQTNRILKKRMMELVRDGIDRNELPEKLHSMLK